MNPLAKKLRLREDHCALLVHAPAAYEALLAPIPSTCTIYREAAGRSSFDFVQLFVRNSAELERAFPLVRPLLHPDTVFWITYPKKSSGLATDLEMMKSWTVLEKNGYASVTAAAVDATWTALRWKPAHLVKRSESAAGTLEGTVYKEYIDTVKREILLPEDLEQELQAQPPALKFFHTLSFSNRKEYVLWILTAKQEKTRLQRLAKTVDKLLSGKKNPSEK